MGELKRLTEAKLNEITESSDHSHKIIKKYSQYEKMQSTLEIKGVSDKPM